jgi:hypothetical protein
MFRWLMRGTAVTMSGRLVVAVMVGSSIMGALGFDAWRTLTAPTVFVVREVEPVHVWDLANPWERCLAAMEAAEIPGDMWECYEYPREMP